MKVGLACSDNTRTVLKELVTARNIEVDDNAGVFIVESGSDIPRGRVAILFDWSIINGLMELLEQLSKEAGDKIDNIVGKSGEDRYEVIPLTQVYFFEARGNNAWCITVNNEFRVREKLYELEAKLPQNRFARVGKSFIVNIGAVKEIIPWFGRRLVLKFVDSKREIEVSKNYVRSFKEFLGM